MSHALKRAALFLMVTSSAAALSGHSVPRTLGAPPPQLKADSDRVALTRALPPLDGAHLEVTLIEVNYAPGESSTPHSHPCAVIGYILQGAYRTQVQGEAERILHPGDTFYEAPNGVHVVSANASQTEPAKFLAYFLCDRHTPLTVRPPAAKDASKPAEEK
jgi:quercetin dioxygenase-like cupin family protein